MSKKQSKAVNVIVNKNQPSEQILHEEMAQLILSPFVHLFNIDESTKCLFNSLTLKKLYLTNKKYEKVLSDLSKGERSNDVKELIDLKFVVPQGFNAEKVFDAVASSLLRKKPQPSLALHLSY